MNATKLLKMKKKEVRKIRRELGDVLIVIARLEKKRVKLGIHESGDNFWLESLRERVKLLKATADKIEQLPEVIAS